MGVSATSSGCNVEPSYSLLLCLSFRICKLRPTRAGWCTVIMKMGGLVPCGATQDGRVMVESSDKKWSTGERNGKPLQHSCLENSMNSMKRQKDMILKDELPGWQVLNMLYKKSREKAPEGMKRLSQSENNTQLWMCLVKVKSNAVKSNSAWESGMLGP